MKPEQKVLLRFSQKPIRARSTNKISFRQILTSYENVLVELQVPRPSSTIELRTRQKLEALQTLF